MYPYYPRYYDRYDRYPDRWWYDDCYYPRDRYCDWRRRDRYYDYWY